ncbi:MAG: SpoIIE family protein phosphatase [Erysipelotrichaceae bacterium]|nr:SpoIIE family protein phosphatase [Erysipelotrichaceae bacterium]
MRSLAIIAIIPVVTSLILHLLFQTRKMQSLSYMKKQAIAGVVFGIIAICSTEFGVPFNGAIINVRDSAPLCAALIFGSPAGLIAGFIGGIERWFCVYWGGGYYTRLACSISTCLTGVIGAFLKKNLFDDKIPDWSHAFIIGVICEVIHMLMIFFTNMTDVKTAFQYVEACSVPMIFLNAIAVSFTAFLIDSVSPEFRSSEKKQTLSVQFQKILIYIVLIGFITSTAFSQVLQNGISQTETDELLRMNIMDAVADVKSQSDEALLSINRVVVDEIALFPDSDLKEMKKRFNVSEIDIIDENGIITASSEEENVGFDMASGEQSREFLCLLEGTEYFVQEYQPMAKDSSIMHKYSGIAIDKGFVQVAYGEKEFREDLNVRLKNVATYRHIGESGSILIIDNEGNIVSISLNDADIDNTEYRVELDPNGTEEYTVYQAKINDADYYYMFTNTEGFQIYAILPRIEADFSKKLSVYLNLFLESIIFGALFVAIYFIIKLLIVNNIQKINDSLAEITEGNLDNEVNIRINKEFSSLSDGINTTVASLKHFIAEANQRIDNELKYAAQIQSSALPSLFPEREEYEIYALMDPAKVVGGDFYDFYEIRHHVLVFMVADVAGKGIPASLFMMRAKTILKTYAENNISLSDIFTNANYQLCEGNDADMFVTAWMAFLDLNTGVMKYVNAGHNRPLIRRKDGQFEYLQGPAGFVLGGMEGIVYKEQTTTLEPGDELFLYTDGVTEATSTDSELFGDNRLKDCANRYIGLNARNLCGRIKEEVDAFYEGNEQFDDITELSMQFKKLHVGKSRKQ